jgi:hypothetical protein
MAAAAYSHGMGTRCVTRPAIVVASYLMTILLGTVALRTLLPHPQRT